MFSAVCSSVVIRSNIDLFNSVQTVWFTINTASLHLVNQSTRKRSTSIQYLCDHWKLTILNCDNIEKNLFLGKNLLYQLCVWNIYLVFACRDSSCIVSIRRWSVRSLVLLTVQLLLASVLTTNLVCAEVLQLELWRSFVRALTRNIQGIFRAECHQETHLRDLKQRKSSWMQSWDLENLCNKF